MTDANEYRDEFFQRVRYATEVFREPGGRAGWDVPAPAASMFAWAEIPEPFKTLGSIEFATLLVEKAEVFSTSHRAIASSPSAV